MLNFLFGFHGRVRRTHYFLASLAAGAILGCAFFGAFASGLSITDFGGDNQSIDWDFQPFGFLAAFIVGIACFWALLAITVKRWHDVGVTGWFAILSLPGLTHLPVFLLLCLLLGTVGANTYGEDPRGRTATPPTLSAPAAA